MTNTEINDLLTRFAQAWSSQDPAQVALYFCEDGEYRASKGSFSGLSAKGRKDISQLVKKMFAVDRNCMATTNRLLIDGQMAAWQWRYDFPDGSFELGSDFFEFRDGLIALKDAYRKVITDLDTCQKLKQGKMSS
ncbi:nuclear transport factor 2 family protein [Parasphingorhabdus halotolerans]|uniref:Nuclear transport factor 2 family protein n=1 Tax=Parasphingorhabdus halotolerans TaxID=2725558 RepID=A0A6H2DNZ6_9SPHN|nr:nuclear transport factor 2 family protein [Parasphingorhabdus halotolerans]QJB69918.1 nuclear transport factor 2 family protein [Parasphingorhabdus halotolerans]